MVLDHREKRVHQMKSILKEQQTSFGVSIKANVPYPYKNHPYAYILIKHFYQMLNKNNQSFFDDGPDGPSFFVLMDEKDGTLLKESLIDIESKHPLGRLIDLDLVFDNYKQLSRVSVKRPQRICYLCDNLAHICVREQRHSKEEVFNHIETLFLNGFSDFITQNIEYAMHSELELEHKFGCVEKKHSGSHKDMNYDLMIQAKHAILPFFKKMFILGLVEQNQNLLIEKAKQIGLEAEKNMLIATHGINCYKGLIFVLGYVLIAFGQTLHQKKSYDDFFETIKTLSKNVLKDFSRPPKTFGEKAYQMYHFLGARGEVYQGLPSIQRVLSKYQPKTFHQQLRDVYMDLILLSEDSVLLKRAGSLKRYQDIKNEIKKIDRNDYGQIKAFDQQAIHEGLSFGGAADLLVVAIFINQLKGYF